MLTDPALKSKVDALWDRFWSGEIANPLTAIESRAVPKDGDVTRTARFVIINKLCRQQMSFIHKQRYAN